MTKRSSEVSSAPGRGTRPLPRTRESRTAAYLLVVLTAGAYLPSPLYPGYQQAFGFSDLTMTLVYATFALITAPALLLFGPASDALGPRPVLRASVLLAAAGSVCFALADGPAWLLAGRAAQGLALGGATGAATALMVRSAAPHRRLHASMLAGTAFVAGTAAGPIAAGALAQYAPAPTLLPYLIHLALLAEGLRRISALTAAPVHRRRWRPTRPRVPDHLRARFAAAAATGFLAWTAAGLFLAVIPALLTRAAGIDDLAVTGGLVGAVLVCAVLAQPLVARCGPALSQLIGLAALGCALTVLAATGGGSLPATLVAAVGAGIGNGMAYGGATASVDAAAPDEQRGSINSALYLVFYLGAGVPAVAVGLLTLWTELATAVSWLSATAALLTLPAAAAVPLVHRFRRTAPAPARVRRGRAAGPGRPAPGRPGARGNPGTGQAAASHGRRAERRGGAAERHRRLRAGRANHRPGRSARSPGSG